MPRSEANLRDQAAVNRWFADKRPQVVFLAAAVVANDTLRAEFLYDNPVIATDVIHAAHIHDTEKLMLLGSSGISPKLAPQPLREDAMLTGRWSRPTSPMRLRRSPGSRWRRPIAASTTPASI